VTDTTTPIISTTNEPDFQAGAGRWYPANFFGFSSVGESEQQRDQLTAFAAQLQTDTNGTTGLLRPYTQMVFQVNYEDPTITTAAAQALAADTTAPVIQSVTVRAAPLAVALAATGETLVVVAASDNGGAPLDVSATYAVGKGTWASANFVGPSANGLYLATLPVQPANARFVVRATDSAGNSSYYTAKGRLTTTISNVTWLPLIVR
jgi:DNA-binding beta-propeller fold protein YncE